MIFTNTQNGIRIELISSTELKLDLVSENDQQLVGIGRMLTAYIRRAPLDGGNRVNFEVVRNEGHILCRGNLTEVIFALCELECITDELKNSISMGLDQMLGAAPIAIPAAPVSESRITSPFSHIGSAASLFPQPHCPSAETQAQRAQRYLDQFSELASGLSPEEQNQFSSPILRILQLPGLVNVAGRLTGQQQEAHSPLLRGRS